MQLKVIKLNKGNPIIKELTQEHILKKEPGLIKIKDVVKIKKPVLVSKHKKKLVNKKKITPTITPKITPEILLTTNEKPENIKKTDDTLKYLITSMFSK